MSMFQGKNISFIIFGESRGPAIGVTCDGIPSGCVFNEAELKAFMKRRSSGGKYTSKRTERDKIEFISGVKRFCKSNAAANGLNVEKTINENMQFADSEETDDELVTNGFPLTALIYNENAENADQEEFKKVPRPGHADYPAFVKYGEACDMAGGGHFSGRLTAPLCIIGGICKQFLSRRGIKVVSHVQSIGNCSDTKFIPDTKEPPKIYGEVIPVLDTKAEERMLSEVEKVSKEGDSVGGVIECGIWNLPVGVGGLMFDSLESRISEAIFAIPGVKGIEFGAGFESAFMRGSENNDPFNINDGKIVTKGNNHGGILGGLSSGMPIIFRVAFKPVPTIQISQDSVEMNTMTETVIKPSKKVYGRNDSCIVLRATPVVEAAVAVVLFDLILGK